MKRTILAVALVLACGTSAAWAAAGEVVLDQSKTNIAKSSQAQRFIDYLDLKPGQEKLPLNFTFTNGSDTAPGFTWLRVSIAGRPYFTERDFRGGRVMNVNMTGDLGSGSSQIMILAGGAAGATISWNLTTPAVVLDALKPDKAATGARVSLSGSNFGSTPEDNAVQIGDTAAEVLSATKSLLEVKVPNDAKAGKNKVIVSVHGIKSEPKELTVQPKPEVTGVNLISAPAGTPLVVSGKNFSANAKDNIVYVGGSRAEVTEASPTSLTTQIPPELDQSSPVWFQPVVVEVNGVKSNDDVTVNVQSRYIEAPESE